MRSASIRWVCSGRVIHDLPTLSQTLNCPLADRFLARATRGKISSALISLRTGTPRICLSRQYYQKEHSIKALVKVSSLGWAMLSTCETLMFLTHGFDVSRLASHVARNDTQSGPWLVQFHEITEFDWAQLRPGMHARLIHERSRSRAGPCRNTLFWGWPWLLQNQHVSEGLIGPGKLFPPLR